MLQPVQEHSLLCSSPLARRFHDFSHADIRKLQHGNSLGQHRLLVTRFSKGDYIMRKGEPATFLAILLQGELGIRLGKGSGFPRRLHKGSLFGERGMFSGNARAADVIALADGYIGTMLYSELELLADAHPETLRAFNLQMAKGALEERLADTGISVDDLDPHSLEQQTVELMAMQAACRWKSRHAELQERREGLYADLYAEKEAHEESGSALGSASAALRGGRRGRSAKATFKGIISRAGQAVGARKGRHA